MLQKSDIERMALETFSFLEGYGFRKPLVQLDNMQGTLSYLSEAIGVEVELDWMDKAAFVLIVRLESGKLPDGYYVSKADGKPCRVHLKQALYNIGYRNEQVNAEALYKKKKKKMEPPSFERMKAMLEKSSTLLKGTVEIITSKQVAIFMSPAI